MRIGKGSNPEQKCFTHAGGPQKISSARTLLQRYPRGRRQVQAKCVLAGIIVPDWPGRDCVAAMADAVLLRK